jgi:two-component system, chemotaxis family, chemotaxis protein CheY
MANVLVIDDEEQLRRLVARILRAEGHEVRVAANGREGLQMFREARPALLITDIVMPDQEGIETIIELRREAPEFPILAISGGGEGVYLKLAAGVGATETLAKPFGADELVAAVERLLAN